MTIDQEYVRKFKKAYESRYSGQRTLDTQQLDLYLQKHMLDVRKPANDTTLKPVGSGEAGYAIDQRTAVLSGSLFVRVSPRGGADAERHASDRLEPFINASIRHMDQEVAVKTHVTKQIVLYGEAFTIGPLPAPFFWGNDELAELVEKGDLKEIEKYKADHFPIVWRHWDTRNVYCSFNDKGEPHEAVYCRKMYASDIIARWGESALPAKNGFMGIGKGYAEGEQIEVVDFVNDYCVATVIGDGKTATMPIYYEHNMGTTPICYFPGNVLPENDQGWRRAGFLFHAREMLVSLDETLTDIRTAIREFTIAPPMVFLNAEARSAMDGWQTELDVSKETTVNMLIGESAERFPISQPTVDLYKYIDLARGNLNNQLYREALGGTGPSGQSAVHLNTANQIAKAELQTYHDGLERGFARAGELILRSVLSLNKHLETAYSKVTLRPKDSVNKSKPIEVSPKDVKDWLGACSAQLKLALPVNEGANVTNYQVAISSGMYDPYTGREVFGSIEDPAAIDDRWAEWKLFNAMTEGLIQIATQRGLGAAAQTNAASPEELLQRSANLPGYVGEVVGEMSGVPSPGRIAGNVTRTGREQGMSQLGSMNGGVPAEPLA